MFPNSRREWSVGRLGGTFIAIAAMTAAISSGARAIDENEQRSEVIGTFNLQSEGAWPHQDDRPVTGAPAQPPLRTESRRAADPETRRLFEDAVDDLEAGERDSAQRLFEQIVAHAPDSDLATEARRYLADLYAGGIPARRAAQPQPWVREAVPQPRAQPVRRGIAVSAETELKFIAEAGDRVFFSAGSAELGQRARSVLSQQARWLKTRPEFDVLVEGHADDAPLDAGRQHDLAAARAESVRRRLIEEGVHAARISVVEADSGEMVADCALPECAAQNRRVLTRLTENRGMRQFTGYGATKRDDFTSDAPGLGSR